MLGPSKRLGCSFEFRLRDPEACLFAGPDGSPMSRGSTVDLMRDSVREVTRDTGLQFRPEILRPSRTAPAQNIERVRPNFRATCFTGRPAVPSAPGGTPLFANVFACGDFVERQPTSVFHGQRGGACSFSLSARAMSGVCITVIS